MRIVLLRPKARAFAAPFYLIRTCISMQISANVYSQTWQFPLSDAFVLLHPMHQVDYIWSHT